MTEAAPPRKMREGQIVKVDSFVWPRTSIETVRAARVRGKFQTFVFLEGEQSFWLDEQFFHIDAGHGASRRPKALTFTLSRDTDIRLLKGSPAPLNKVSITSPLEWMDHLEVATASRSPELVNFMAGHLNHLLWDPGPEVVAIAEQIAAPPSWLGTEMLELYRSARGLDMMLSACRRLGGGARDPLGSPSSPTGAQMSRVRDFILDRLHQDLQITEIARETGTSVRSLQRKFRDCYGESVFDFVRGARLERAREALVRDQVSVAEAARLAGYASAEAFSTAFRNRFGDAPRQLRAGAPPA